MSTIGSKKLQLAGYELVEIIGQGGMGVVYKARQISMDRLVAVKVLTPKLAADKSFTSRFLREARATAKLNHPNVVAGIDVGESAGMYYFAMEFVEGETALKKLLRDGPLPMPVVERIAVDIAHALRHAESQGMVHRDVKPENIMVTSENLCKLLDLGLALHAEDVDRLNSDSGRAIGSPKYISPEQAQGLNVIDIRADIYCFGATLYHLITGEALFTGNPPDLLMGHVSGHASNPLEKRPDLNPGWAFVLERMLAKKPEERYPNIAALQEDLRRVLAGRTPQAAMLPEVESSVEGTHDVLERKEMPYAAGLKTLTVASVRRLKWVWLVLAVLAVLGGLVAVGYFVVLK